MFYITFNNGQLDKVVFCGVGDIERKWLKNNRDPNSRYPLYRKPWQEGDYHRQRKLYVFLREASVFRNFPMIKVLKVQLNKNPAWLIKKPATSLNVANYTHFQNLKLKSNRYIPISIPPVSSTSCKKVWKSTISRNPPWACPSSKLPGEELLSTGKKKLIDLTQANTKTNSTPKNYSKNS